jgi:hypothetical protein
MFSGFKKRPQITLECKFSCPIMMLNLDKMENDVAIDSLLPQFFIFYLMNLD